MYKIALHMLIGDRAKFIMLILALTISVLLMTQQCGVFFGIMRWQTAALRNTKMPIWVVDEKVEQVNEIKPMRDTDLARVKSVQGVAWAVPLYQSVQQARLYNGLFKPVLLIGVDTQSLIGIPKIIEGKLSDLWEDRAVMIDLKGVEKLSIPGQKPIGVGDLIDINDNELKIVGIVKTEPSFFGYPFLYTTYDRAIQTAPKQRRNLGFVLVEPQEGVDVKALARRIEENTHLKAYTEEEFFWSTIWWFIKNTGIPISFGTTITLGFIVGAAVSGQTFYMFILENMRYLGALKAMGATTWTLARMLLVQASFVGFIGYGLGLGLASIFGMVALKHETPPFYLPGEVLLLTLGAIMAITSIAVLFAIRRLVKLEPSEVFRG